MIAADALRGVLDTSTVILLERISDTSTLPGAPLITAVTLAELSVGPLVAVDRDEQAVRQARPLYTCNPVDFEHIDELDLRPIPHPDSSGN